MDQLKNDLLSILEKHGYRENPRIQIIDKRIRDGFFNENKNIYASSEYWFEDVDVDKTKWLFNEYEINENFILEDVDFIEKLIDDWAEDNNMKEEEIEEIKTYTLEDITESYPELYRNIIEEIKSMDYYELEDYLDVIFGIEYPEEELNEIEMLCYWTVYFEPEYWNEDVAWKVRLFPFEFKGRNYLALGGCGMDLSPKLDAYQALTVGSIPSNSHFLDDGRYAKYVVGEEIYNKVMKAIKLDSPTIVIN